MNLYLSLLGKLKKCENDNPSIGIILSRHDPLFDNIKQLIEESKQQVAVAVNATMSMLYWRIEKQINEELLQNARTEYGEQVIKSLASQLHDQYGKGWSEKQLRHCM